MPAPQADLLPYKLLHKYPGMRPRDEVIWDKYIQQRPDVFDYCYYNVAVGDPSTNDNVKDEMMYNGMYGVAQWRVDVLASRNDKQYVIEVKPHADTHSIGEVLAYKALLIREGKILPNAKAIIVTDDASVIMQQVCQLMGIGLVEV